MQHYFFKFTPHSARSLQHSLHMRLTLSSATAYHFPTDEEEEGNLWKQKAIEGCFRCIDIFCVWDWGFPWSLLQKTVAFIVFDPFAELGITLAIGINTLFMALDYHGIERNPTMKNTLKVGNKARKQPQ